MSRALLRAGGVVELGGVVVERRSVDFFDFRLGRRGGLGQLGLERQRRPRSRPTVVVVVVIPVTVARRKAAIGKLWCCCGTSRLVGGGRCRGIAWQVDDRRGRAVDDDGRLVSGSLVDVELVALVAEGELFLAALGLPPAREARLWLSAAVCTNACRTRGVRVELGAVGGGLRSASMWSRSAAHRPPRLVRASRPGHDGSDDSPACDQERRWCLAQP